MLHEAEAQFSASLTHKNKPRVYSYTRFSTPEQALGDSYRRQTDAVAKWALRKGVEMDDRLSFADEGVSAYRGTNAGCDKGLGRFLHACRNDLIPEGSFLVVESLDRLSRMDASDAQFQFLEIVRAGVTVVTLSDGQEYSRDRLQREPFALMIALMVAMRANEESKTKSRRVSAAWAEKRRKVTAGEAVKLTEIAPGWLQWVDGKWAVHPVHGETVKRVYRMTIEGIGEHKIAETFNREGVPLMGRGRRMGTMWHRSAISKILRNNAVTGALTPGKIEYVQGKRTRVMEAPVANAFPVLIGDEEWLAVRALKDGLTTSIKGRGAKAPLANVLSGLARCPDCGAAMTRVMKGTQKKKGRAKLVCTRAKAGAEKHYVSVLVDDVHEAIFGGWQKLLADVPAGDLDAHLDREHADAHGTLTAMEDHLSDLLDALDRQPSSALAASIRQLEQRMQTMRELLQDIDERRAMSDRGIIHSRLDSLAHAMQPEDVEAEPVSIEKVNAGLRMLFAGVVVDHHSGALVFRWKQGGETAMLYKWVSQ
ncbi:MAG: recombinase family protein [Pseudomonadota bacterium]